MSLIASLIKKGKGPLIRPLTKGIVRSPAQLEVGGKFQLYDGGEKVSYPFIVLEEPYQEKNGKWRALVRYIVSGNAGATRCIYLTDQGVVPYPSGKFHHSHTLVRVE